MNFSWEEYPNSKRKIFKDFGWKFAKYIDLFISEK